MGFVIQNPEGRYLRHDRGGWVERLQEALVFRSWQDADTVRDNDIERIVSLGSILTFYPA